MKFNVDASMRDFTRSASVGYVVRDHHAIVIMIKRKQIGDCVIQVAECLAVCETTIMAIKKNLQTSIIQMTQVGCKFHQC